MHLYPKMYLMLATKFVRVNKTVLVLKGLLKGHREQLNLGTMAGLEFLESR